MMAKGGDVEDIGVNPITSLLSFGLPNNEEGRYYHTSFNFITFMNLSLKGRDAFIKEFKLVIKYYRDKCENIVLLIVLLMKYPRILSFSLWIIIFRGNGIWRILCRSCAWTV
jgi:hypothetical protein